MNQNKYMNHNYVPQNKLSLFWHNKYMNCNYDFNVVPPGREAQALGWTQCAQGKGLTTKAPT
jgi:hypothetical protein